MTSVRPNVVINLKNSSCCHGVLSYHRRAFREQWSYPESKPGLVGLLSVVLAQVIILQKYQHTIKILRNRAGKNSLLSQSQNLILAHKEHKKKCENMLKDYLRDTESVQQLLKFLFVA